MDASIESCSLAEWYEQFKKIDASISGKNPFFAANIFSAQQYFGNELFQKAKREAFVLKQSGIKRAWLLCYPLSDETVRFRGIVCEGEYRRRGFGRELIEQVCNLKKISYKQVLLFVPESKIPFYKSCGFAISPEFTPRKVEYYNSTTQSYDLDVGEVFCVMKKDL